MPTRNIYLKISRILQPYQSYLGKILFWFWLGGFFIIFLISKQLENESFLNYSSKIWFTTCAILGLAYGITHWFNPERDPIDKSLLESWNVIFINVAIVVAFWVWSFE